jgi:hypothetical protein
MVGVGFFYRPKEKVVRSAGRLRLGVSFASSLKRVNLLGIRWPARNTTSYRESKNCTEKKTNI